MGFLGGESAFGARHNGGYRQLWPLAVELSHRLGVAGYWTDGEGDR